MTQRTFLYRIDVVPVDGAMARPDNPAAWTPEMLPGRRVYLLTPFERAVHYESEPFRCPYLPTGLGTHGVEDAWTFQPAFVSHDAVRHDSERNSGQLTVRISASHPVAQLWKYDSPGHKIFLALAECADVGEGTPAPATGVWFGQVSTGTFVDDATVFELRCMHILGFTSQPAFVRKHPRLDPATPFDGSTGRIKPNEYDDAEGYFRWREDGELTLGAGGLVSGTVVEVPEAANRPDGFFDGGLLVISPDYTLVDSAPSWYPRTATPTEADAAESDWNGGIRRTILTHEGSTLMLDIPLPPMSFTDMNLVTLLVGYDGTLEQCETRFDNVKNFGGFPWIPEKNIFETGLKSS